MNKSKLYILILIFSTINWYDSQIMFIEDKAYKDIQNSQINKPTVGKLNDFSISDENVNLSTGVLLPSISLTGISTKFLSQDINLIYKNGNGIRVNDISSDVGLGWEIETGGSISRKVNGFADEGKLYYDAQVGVPGNNFVIQINENNFLNGWLDFANWNPYKTPQIPALMPETPQNNQSLGGAIQNFVNSVKNNNFEAYKWFRNFRTGVYLGPDGGGGWPPNTQPINGSTIADLSATSGFGWRHYDVDGEPDEYFFNFGKYSGKFVFDGDRKPVLVPHIPGLKVESPYGPASNNSWIFTTPEGVKYHFYNTAGYYEVLNSATNTAPFHDDWSGTTPNVNEGLGITENISKWYLSKVVGINGETIEYSYANLPDLVYSEKAEIKQVFRPSSGSTQTPPTYFPVSLDAGFHERILDRTTQFRLKGPKRLLNVKTSDNNRIDFIYNGLERGDIDQSQNSIKRKSLSSIEKYDYNNKLIEKIDFNQNYFDSGCNTYDCKRLKLNNIKRINTVTLNSYLTTSFEYNHVDNLPKRNSNQQDYWGFFNSNTVNSLIPNVNSFGGYNYSGADRRPSETKASANILKKIIYPTQGSVEYVYELNDFRPSQFNDFPITNNKTGGLRIKNIIKKDKATSVPITTLFTYKLSNGNTSGELPDLLLNSTMQENNNGAGRMFERQKVEVDQNSGETSVYVMIYSTPKYLFTNDLIRYSKVIVETQGKGSKEYTLSSFSTNPDDQRIGRKWLGSSSGFQPTSSTITNSLYSYTVFNTPTISTPDKSYMRGLILSQIEKDNTGNILRETLNEYQINPSGYTPITVYGIGASSIDSFIAEDSRIGSLDFSINFYKSDYVFLNKSIAKDYVSNPPLETIENNSYNSVPLLSSKNISFANNDVYSKAYKYASDKQIQKLIDANIVSLPVETEVKKNGKIINKSEIKYDNPANLYPSSAVDYDVDGNNSVATITYDLYDDKGNLLQFTNKYGIPVTLLWGYKGTEPIAKVEGISYADLSTKLGFSNTNTGYKTLDIVTKSDADTNDSYETQTLLPSLKLFRQNNLLKDYQITTYTYDPLVGLKTITSASGHKENYKYDGTNKLEKITDQNDNIVKEFKYKYADTIFYNDVQSMPFIRNNCTNGETSTTPVIYTVPAGTFSSTVSLADANQMAINDINTNGQNNANSNGICIGVHCTISPNYNISIYYSSIQQSSPGNFSGILSMPLSNPSVSWSSGVMIGTLGVACRPSSIKYISTTGNPGTIVIYPTGEVHLQTSASGGSQPLSFYFNYTKN